MLMDSCRFSLFLPFYRKADKKEGIKEGVAKISFFVMFDFLSTEQTAENCCERSSTEKQESFNCVIRDRGDREDG